MLQRVGMGRFVISDKKSGMLKKRGQAGGEERKKEREFMGNTMDRKEKRKGERGKIFLPTFFLSD